MIGYAMCGSFCTHKRSLHTLKQLVAAGEDMVPIVSEIAAATDTRFGQAEQLLESLRTITGRSPISTIVDAEPLGPHSPLDALIIAPCTGNTLAKMAHGTHCENDLFIGKDSTHQSVIHINNIFNRESSACEI